MPRKPRSIIVHLRVRTSTLDGYLEYVPEIHDPAPVRTTSTVHFEEINTHHTDESPSDLVHMRTASPVPYVGGIQQEESRDDSVNINAPRELNGVFQCNHEHQDVRVYPRKSRTVCWWDGYHFDTKPCFIPKRQLVDRSYSVYGNFCSPECAMAYLEAEGNLDNETRWERAVMLNHLARLTYSGSVQNVNAAMPRWTLRDYGGEFSIEEFRRVNTSPSSEYETFYPPITTDIPIIRVKHVMNHAQKTRPSRGVIHEERFRRAEENIRAQASDATQASDEVPGVPVRTRKDSSQPRNTSTGRVKNAPRGGLASMMNIRIIESPSATT